MSRTECLSINLYHVTFPTGANRSLGFRNEINYNLHSFDLWPIQMPQTKERMVSAGFKYLGIGDHVQCVECSLCLRDWERDDDPWEEHARWSKDCPLVLQGKGQAFKDTAIDEIIAAVPDNKSKKEPKNAVLDNKPEKGRLAGFPIGSKETRSITEIAQENEKMKWARVCKICHKSPARTMIIPCGHFLACEDCSDSFVEECLACGGQINSTIQVFEG